MNRAKELGYEILLFYVGLESVELAKERVRQRVVNGGHGIPGKDIERRYYESIENLKKMIPICNRVIVYDNTESVMKVGFFVDGICVDRAENVPKWCGDIFREG